jgi:hypothetical protein
VRATIDLCGPTLHTDPDSITRLYEQAAVLARKHKDDEHCQRLLFEYATQLHRKKEFDKCVQAFAEALAAYKAHPAFDRDKAATMLNLYKDTLKQLKRTDEADKLSL